jgi:septum site-determining protein MinD
MLTANLASALSERGKRVIAVDANLTTPNLGIHFGIPLSPITLHDVLKGAASVYDAMYEYKKGLKILPAGLSLKDLRGTDARSLSNALLELLGTSDIILLDSSAGLGKEALAAIESSDEILVVVNPDVSSVTDALKALKLSKEIGTKTIGIVVNKRANRKHELSNSEILNMLENHKILAEIPDDTKVARSIAVRLPVVQRYPNIEASNQIRKLAAHVLGEEYKYSIPWYKRFLR